MQAEINLKNKLKYKIRKNKFLSNSHKLKIWFKKSKYNKINKNRLHKIMKMMMIIIIRKKMKKMTRHNNILQIINNNNKYLFINIL